MLSLDTGRSLVLPQVDGLPKALPLLKSGWGEGRWEEVREKKLVLAHKVKKK